MDSNGQRRGAAGTRGAGSAERLTGYRRAAPDPPRHGYPESRPSPASPYPGGAPAGARPRSARTGSYALLDGAAWVSRPPVDAPPVAFSRPPRPTERTLAARVGVRVLFWLGLAGAVLPWWLNTPAGSLGGDGALLTAAGRITGLVGGYVLLVQILLMSRVRWLERSLGSRQIALWHRELGGYLVVAVLAHVVLTILGYARTEGLGVFGETWAMLTTLEDMIAAFVATALLVGVALLGIRSLRRALSYEVWYYAHLTSYLVVILGYGHQFATGQELADPGFGRYYWVGLYAVVAAALLWGRVIAPVRLNLRHRLRVERVAREGPNMVSVYVTGRQLERLDAQAGQFFRWRFLASGYWWTSLPFSLSAAPNGRWLRLTVKAVGDHTEELHWLRPGVRVLVEGPSGEFTAGRRTRPRALLIAGGSGIAPIRALLEELPPGATVIYRGKDVDDLVFRRELEWLAQARGTDLRYVLGSRDEPGPRALFTPRGLGQLVPDVRDRDVYLCGPQGLIDGALAVLRKLRVPRRQIHLDPFEI